MVEFQCETGLIQYGGNSLDYQPKNTILSIFLEFVSYRVQRRSILLGCLDQVEVCYYLSSHSRFPMLEEMNRQNNFLMAHK